MRDLKDFFGTDGSAGEIRRFAPEVDLERLADGDSGLFADEEDAAAYPDEATPDPLAHLYGFERRLQGGDPETVAEWRGMLCTVFFSGLITGRNTVRRIPAQLYGDSGHTPLAGLFSACFERYGGFSADAHEEKDRTAKFLFYEHDGEPFALIAPGLILTPMAHYDRRMFADSPFTEEGGADQKGLPVWSGEKILTYFAVPGHRKQAIRFVEYLSSLYQIAEKSKGPLYAFICDIKARIPDAEWISVPSRPTSAEELLGDGFTERLDDDEKGIWQGDFLEDDLLCFLSYLPQDEPYGDVENAEEPEEYAGAWESYRIDYGGRLLTPVRITGFCGEQQPVYVVPPVKPFFLEASASGKLTFSGWKAETAPGLDSAVRVSHRCVVDGETYTLSRTYTASGIVVASALPYISLWPFVKAETGPGVCAPAWREYYIAVHPGTYDLHDCYRPDYDRIGKAARKESGEALRLIREPERILIGTASGVGYDVSTDPFRSGPRDPDRCFRMIRTERFPGYLTVSVLPPDCDAPLPVGCWAVNDSLAAPLPANGAHSGVIGFDLGHFSTKMLLDKDGSHKPGPVPGPGAYLYDVFNPYWTRADADAYKDCRLTWEMLQTYYLFGSLREPLSDFICYPQYMHATGEAGKVGEPCNFLCGRAVVPEYNFFAATVSQDRFCNRDILRRFSWSSFDQARYVRYITGFLLAPLTWAVLAARTAGCKEIELRVSFREQDPTVAAERYSAVVAALAGISGLGADLRLRIVPVSRANIAYLAGSAAFSLPGGTPERGKEFLIADIGSHFTDLTVCGRDPSAKESSKDPACIRYAGREIGALSLLHVRDLDGFRRRDASSMDGGEFRWWLREALSGVRASDEPFEKKRSSDAVQSAACLLSNSRFQQGTPLGRFAIEMTCKYLALNWALGCYLAAVNKAEKNQSGGSKEYTVCLIGGAAALISAFILPSVPEDTFMKMCGIAATRGFCECAPKESGFAVIRVVLAEKVSAASVAYGLCVLSSDGAEPPVPQSAEPKDPPSSPEPDPELIQRYFDHMMRTVFGVLDPYLLREERLPDPDTVLDRFSDQIKKYIWSPLSRRRVKEISDFDQTPIPEAVYALYTFEKLLNDWLDQLQ